MRIVIATTLVPFVSGGAEVMVAGLARALRGGDHDVEIAAIPFQWSPPERILDHMLACRLLDLTHGSGRPIDLLIGTKFPAYLIEHPRKVIWLTHEHRTAYSLWDHAAGDLILDPNGAVIRDAIRQADQTGFREAQKLFTISKTVTARVREHLGFESTPLYQPPAEPERFFSAEPEDYLFFPSRLCSYKRQDLALRALAKTREPVRLRFCGVPDSPGYEAELRALADRLHVTSRVEWLGLVTEERKRELYARSVAVVFPPIDEDYGFVTLEAMLSSKPVITCTDSGGPLEFITAGENGWIAPPTPEALAQAIDAAWRDRAQAREFGRAGRAKYDRLGISWSPIVEALCA